MEMLEMNELFQINALPHALAPNRQVIRHISLAGETLVLTGDGGYQMLDWRCGLNIRNGKGGELNFLSPCSKWMVMQSFDGRRLDVEHVETGKPVLTLLSEDNRPRMTPVCFHGNMLWCAIHHNQLSLIRFVGDDLDSVHHIPISTPWIFEHILALDNYLALIGYVYRGEKSDWYAYPLDELELIATKGSLDFYAKTYETSESFALGGMVDDLLYCMRDFGVDPSLEPGVGDWNGLALIDVSNTRSDRLWPITNIADLLKGAPLIIGQEIIAVSFNDRVELRAKRTGDLVNSFMVDRDEQRFGKPPILSWDVMQGRFAFSANGEILVCTIL